MSRAASRVFICLYAAAVITGCATPVRTPEVPPGPPRVTFWLPPDKAHLVADEVRIVNSEQTRRRVGGQLLMNLALLPVGGAMVSPFSKEELPGVAIQDDDAFTRRNLRNPSLDFVNQLQAMVDAWVAASPLAARRTFRHPLLVIAPHPRLIYENLNDAEEHFRLTVPLVVQKHVEPSQSMKAPPVMTVDCSQLSDQALPLQTWSQNSYLRVKTELDAAFDACTREVNAHLETLFAE